MIYTGIGIIDSSETCPSTLISTTSLRTYYKFNGNANAAFGTNATPVNSPNYIPSKTGSFDLASNLNGTSQYYNLGTSTDNEPVGTVGWTFSCWVSMSVIQSGNVYNKWTGSGGLRIVLRPNLDILVTFNSQNISFAVPANTFTNSDWFNIILRQATGTNNFTCFLNGVSLGTATRISYGNQSTINLYVGTNKDTNGEFFGGRIDEWAIWNRELTNSEVALIANGQCPITS